MTRIILESPYAGDVEKNIEYARLCLKDSLFRGEAPIASRLLYTQVLNDDNESERALGIEAGLEWASLAEKHVFYVDLGMSGGMQYALERASKNGETIEMRLIL